ncbi:MAG: C45 family autoproteolytic acyltransferase/hydrolase [Phycisphaerae bacterium]
MKHSLKAGQLRQAFVVGLLVVWTGFSSTVRGADPIQGKVGKIGDTEVVTVWGSPSQMGEAHGYLLADRILEVASARLKMMSQQAEAPYDRLAAALLQRVEISPRIREELGGMLRGVERRLGKPGRVESLQRSLTLDDLIILNSGDMIRGLACSGFTVWGERAGDAGVLTARNFDYAVREIQSLGEWIILVRRPTGKKQVATVSFPSYLGAFTGWNEDGVCTFMHDGSGGRDQTIKKSIPLALMLKDLLEDASAAEALSLAESQLRRGTPSPFPYMARVISPIANNSGSPVRVFRVGPGEFGENPVGDTACITTNHYVNEDFSAPPRTHSWSTSRYTKLERGIASPVSLEECWKQLDVVSIADSGLATLHSVVVAPRKRELLMAIVQPGQTLEAATKQRPQLVNFDQLFSHSN